MTLTHEADSNPLCAGHDYACEAWKCEECEQVNHGENTEVCGRCSYERWYIEGPGSRHWTNR